jgi:hypothetical protein
VDCETARDAVFALLDGIPPGVPAADLDAHMGTCEACRSEIPRLADRWMAVNAALSPPPPTEARWKAMEDRILAAVARPAFPSLQAKLAAHAERFLAAAAAETPSTAGLPPIVHRLEIEGEELDVVCHTKDKAVVRLTVVDRKTRETCGRLDGGTIVLGSGKEFRIENGGADVALHEVLKALRFTIRRPDGLELRLRESPESG